MSSRFVGDDHEMRVLVLEAEQPIAASLLEAGYEASFAATGEQALLMARSSSFDAIVIADRTPFVTGATICRALRSSGIWTPLLLLMAGSTAANRIDGLDAGADRCLTSSLGSELLASLRAVVRREAGRTDRGAGEGVPAPDGNRSTGQHRSFETSTS